jgi:hypothetical protein
MVLRKCLTNACLINAIFCFLIFLFIVLESGAAVRGRYVGAGVLHVREALHRHQQLPQLCHLLSWRTGIQKNIQAGTEDEKI